jgi:hypothetical protein
VRSAREAALAVAFLLSLLVPLGEALMPSVSLARGSLAALALLPWLALAPLPGGTRDSSEPAWRGALLAGCLCLPPLCLGAGIDLARGAKASVLGPTCAAGWLVLILWSLAARSAARTPESRSTFAVLWFLLLPCASALRFALAWVPQRAGSEAPGRAPLFAADPLLWCHRWGRAGGLAELGLGELALALAAALFALVLVFVSGRRASVE